MSDKKARKKLKQIEKQLSNVEKECQRIEYRPCLGDTDLRQKEEDLQAIRRKIQELEKSRDRLVFDSGIVRHFEWEDASLNE